jgi:hypothetical protein
VAAAAAATDNTRATPLPNCNAAVTHACTQRSETHKHEQSTANTIARCAAQSHTSHSEALRSAATHTRQHKAAIAILRHSILLTALETAPTMSASYVARMTHTRCFTFSQAQRAPPRTCRLAPRSPLPSRHKHARADTCDETSPTQHNGTAASWRVSPKTTHAHNPRNAHRTLTCRIQTHKPRTPARRPAQHQPLRTAQ